MTAPEPTDDSTADTNDSSTDGSTDWAPAECSAKGCRQPAEWALQWNNPKLHTPERRKTWLACEAHRQSLAAFLELRGFLREVEPFP